MQTEPMTIGERLIGLMKRRQWFLHQRLGGVTPETMRVIKLDHPGKFTRLLGIRMARYEKKSLPQAYFQIPMPLQVVFSRLSGHSSPRDIDGPMQRPEEGTTAAGHSITRGEARPTDQTIELSPKLKDRFSSLLELRLPRVFIHQNVYAEQILKRHNAEAMAIGSHIYFRNESLNFTTPEGLGLLGHELTHVAQQHGSDWRNPAATSGSGQQQERTALNNERLVLHHSPAVFAQVDGNSSTLSSATNLPPAGALLPGHTTARPMFAETTRDIGPLDSPPVPPPPAAGLSADEMMRIKEEVYRDLMMRMKIEFERGA